MHLAPIAPADITEDQEPLFAAMKAGVAAKYDNFVTVRADGAMLGPWGAWLRS
jgi:4-carboxymuconolactone decarboxylase